MDDSCATNLGEWGKEATSACRRDLGGVDRSDHEGVAYADAGDEAADHKEGVVGGEPHEDSSGKEDDLGYYDGVAAAYPVGGSSGGAGADEAENVEDSGEDFDLYVADFEIFLDVDYCSTHYSNIWSNDTRVDNMLRK